MNNEEKIGNLNFVFECEQCTESWSENLLDLIYRCTTEELISLYKYIQTKLKKKDRLIYRKITKISKIIKSEYTP